MIVPQQTEARIFRPNPCISLEEYAKYIGYDECSFFGFSNCPTTVTYECRDIWTLDQRNFVLHYLSEAQQEIEDEIGYFLTADWVVGDISSERDSLYRYVDQQLPQRGYRTNSKRFGAYKSRWKKINAVGTRATAVISAGEAVNYATEPAVIGPVATTVTDVNEIHVFHPGSELEINPSEITLSGGFVTISIPKARLKLEADLAETLDYTDSNSFETEVDITRVYTDTTTQGILLCSKCDICENNEISGCIRVINERQGTIAFESNNLSCNLCGCIAERIGFNYYCGDINVTQKAKEAVIRLAHAKMAQWPCGCEFAIGLWDRDRERPEIITKDVLENPFGQNFGSLVAWQWVKRMKLFSFGEV